MRLLGQMVQEKQPESNRYMDLNNLILDKFS